VSRQVRRILPRSFNGVNVRTPLEKLKPEEFQIDENGDRRRAQSWRQRPGYARFMSGDNVPSFVAEYTDDFNRTDDPTGLGVDWAGGYYGCNAPSIQIVSNEVRPRTGFGVMAAATYTAQTFANDQASQVEIVNIGSSSDSVPGVIIRATSVGGYYVEINGNNNTLRLRRVNTWGTCSFGSGSYTILDEYTTIGSGSAPILSAGDLLRIQANGTTIRGYINNALVLQATDGSHASGDPGIVYNMGAITGSPWRMDNWGGGTSVLSVENVQVSGKPTRLLSFERSDDTVKVAAIYGDGTNPDNVDAFDTGTPEGL
jgi:hypothetical protein